MKPIVAEVGTWFWRLLPANPIVVRVVQAGSKRTQHLWVRAAYLLVLLFVMLIMLVSTGGGSGSSLSDLAKGLTQVFERISILQLALMCLLAPVFTAGAISQEKDAETFNVLLTTPLSNAQIALGSLLSRLFFVIMLLLSGLPIFCITMLFGGVTSEQIFLSFGIAACTALLTGALAILMSVMRVGARGTIFSFYMGIAVFLAAGLALGNWSWTYVPESIVPGSGGGMSFLAPFHPFLALFVALKYTVPPDAAAVGHYGWPLRWMFASPHTAYMTITMLVSVILISMATLFVRRGAKLGEVTWWTRVTRFLEKGMFWKARATDTGERTRRPRRVWSNPVAWREAVTRGSAASSDAVRYGYIFGGAGAGVVLLFAYGYGALGSSTTARAWLTWLVLVEFVSVMLMAANAAATAITREREAGTMELLLSTPLTSRYIIWGKLRGLVSFTIPLLAVPAATVLAAALLDLFRGSAAGPPIVHLASAIYLPPLMLAYSAFACMLGLQMSLKNRRSVQAVLASVGILVVVGFGLGLCGSALIDDTGPVGQVMSPLTFVTAVFIILNPEDAVSQRRLGMTQEVGDALAFFFVGTVIAIGLYGAIVAGTYKAMVTNFDMIVRKQSR